MTIGGLFVVRAAAGAAAVDVRISPWLLLCTALLALFLALAKRRGELVLVGAEATPGRPVLEGYSLALVDQLVTIVAASTVISYCLYTFTARGSKAMMITIPFVLFGVFRYLLLMHRRDLGEEPEEILLRDLPILGLPRGVGRLRGGHPRCDLESLGAGCVRTAIFHPVDDGAALLLHALLQPAHDRFETGEPRVDALPAG